MKILTIGKSNQRACKGLRPINWHQTAKFQPGTRAFQGVCPALANTGYKLKLSARYRTMINSQKLMVIAI
jgi:hypothetical protein